MIIKYSLKYKSQIAEIYPGEYYVTTQKNIILSTILGSCVSVCLHDPVNQVSGINHIMISSKAQYKISNDSLDTKYGIHAMEVLVNEMIKKGAQRSFIQAKVFGGGKVLLKGSNSIAYNNIVFALSYLENEDISVLSQDTGGLHGRKIFFFTSNFKVYLKRIYMSQLIQKTYEKELESFRKNSKLQSKRRNLTLFDD